jgi:UDP-N-acetyl-2-amino-2-deoxyglucuronate dehydrogenase
MGGDELEQLERPMRYVLIGCAATIAPAHLEAIATLPVSLVGMSDIDTDKGAVRAAANGAPFFADHQAMLSAQSPDVAVICTPHPHHVPIALDCFRAGAHVLLEKPIADGVAEADLAIAVAEDTGRVLGVNFPARFRPAVEFARELLAQGELGQVMRVLSVEPWLRTAAYYRSARWRGTWKGEGGGVLLNQAPHMLDVLCHLLGSPTRVWGMTRTRVHAIECEDSAQAMLEYRSGAFGYVSVSTVEAGTDKRLEIVGDRAVLKLSGDRVYVTRFERSLREHMAEGPTRSSPPPARVEMVELEPTARGMHAVHDDFLAALREGRAPRCDGKGALMSLELANAIVLSSFRDEAVSLPLDRAAYSRLLSDLRLGHRTV